MPARVAVAPNVLQVVLSLNPGGTERLVLEIVRRLRPELQIAVCCLDDEGAWGEQLRTENVDVKALRRRSGFRPALGRRIAQFAADHHSNVIHCHQYSPFVYGSIARLWRPSLRVIFTEHGRLSDAPPSQKRRLANRLLSHAPREVYAVWYDVPPRSLARRRAGKDELTAAHNRLPLGTLVCVTNIKNGKCAVVRITDRGITNRRAKIDICKEAAERIGILREGIARVRLEVLPDPPELIEVEPPHAAAR